MGGDAAPVRATMNGLRWVVGGCVVLGALTLIVLVHPGPLPGEIGSIRWLQRRGEPLESIAELVGSLTSTLANLIVLAVPAAIAIRRFGRPARQALVIVLATMFAVQPMYAEVVDRPRPDATQVEVRAERSGPSFPSGESVATATVWGGAAGIAWARRRRRLAAALAVPVVVAAISSSVQGVHWPSDVVAGTVIGAVAAWTVVLLLATVEPFRPRRPAPTAA